MPEWKGQYLDYRLGKKLVKEVRQRMGDDFDPRKPDDRTPLLKAKRVAAVPEAYNIDDPNLNEEEIQQQQPGSVERTKTNPSSSKFPFLGSKDKVSPPSDLEQFLAWLDAELLKVELFYREREQEIYERFLLLQDQLYQLREQKRANREFASKHNQQNHGLLHVPQSKAVSSTFNELAFHTKSVFSLFQKLDLPSLPSTVFLDKWRKKRNNKDVSMTSERIYDPSAYQNRIRNGVSFDDEEDAWSIDSEANKSLTRVSGSDESASNIQAAIQENNTMNTRRDYSLKKAYHVPYLLARKQLKDAVLEYYRSLALLRSYRILNRTAFRKITKKFDKATNSSICKKTMDKIDTESYFQTSDMLDKLTSQVEELYITFFDLDSNDRKHSLEKLKSITYALNNTDMRPPTYYNSFFVSGLMLGFGIPLFVLALYSGLNVTLSGKLPEGRYLMQIWAGFFLVNLIVILFTINLYVFDAFRINYKFIFEFNMATALDFRQFLLLPGLSFALLSLVGWFSLKDFWPNEFPGRDWPWIFFGIVLVVFLWPGRQLYASSRRWLQVALWRLLLSGLYPVEFRDFFLGDILCSLTYSSGNIPFFFCLYAHHWSGILGRGTNTCSSSSSRLMGFFSSLPSILRFLQCVRRYMDTGDWFPHLANMTKYIVTTIYYCLLSVYRIDRSNLNRAAFIFIACINSVYTSSWDIFMDWSLLQPHSKNFLLRDTLFFKRKIYYYAAMVINVILRFQWIFYAFFSHQIQQSAITSFAIALAEILRRFIWIFFRMENEHRTNVILFRASRDAPLPYPISPHMELAAKKLVNLRYNGAGDNSEWVAKNMGNRGTSSATGVSRGDESGRSGDINTLPSGTKLSRRRSTIASISDAVNRAHIKDFQRRAVKYIEEDYSDEEDEEGEDEGEGSSKP